MNDSSRAASNEAAALDRPQPLPRSAYRRFVPLTTRWLDNDAYGHINNVVYYALFDTAVNGVLIEAGAIDVAAGTVIGYVVETRCNYFAPLAFPQTSRPASGSAGSAARACATRSASSPPAGPRPRPAATSSTSTSIVRQNGRSPCPTA